MTSRAQVLWGIVKPAAAHDDVVPVGPEVSRIDLLLRARIQALQDDLTTAHTRIQELQDALALKADVVHTHPRADIVGLPALLNTINARLTALEQP